MADKIRNYVPISYKVHLMVRTRFAPSPTGYLHIGGVRTAFFNWLFARKHGGQFILRIDDTDQSRNVEEALQPILDGFRWLGIDWDEGPEVDGPHAPYFQSQRTDKYQTAVKKMLTNGTAYKDYSRTDEIQAEREAAQAEKRTFVYSRSWMAETGEQADAFEAEGRTAVVRLKMPREGTCLISDRFEVMSNSNGLLNKTWSSKKPMGLASTISPASWMMRNWKSLMSSVLKNISPIRLGRSSSQRVSDTSFPNTLTSPT